MNKFNEETGLSTRKIVNILFYDFNYVILPRKLNAILRENEKPDSKLKGYLHEI